MSLSSHCSAPGTGLFAGGPVSRNYFLSDLTLRWNQPPEQEKQLGDYDDSVYEGGGFHNDVLELLHRTTIEEPGRIPLWFLRYHGRRLIYQWLSQYGLAV